MTRASDEVLIEFGGRLRDVRLSREMSQEALAGLAELDRTYISLLERGKRNPTLVCIAKLAQALSVTVAELFNFDEG